MLFGGAAHASENVRECGREPGQDEEPELLLETFGSFPKKLKGEPHVGLTRMRHGQTE